MPRTGSELRQDALGRIREHELGSAFKQSEPRFRPAIPLPCHEAPQAVVLRQSRHIRAGDWMADADDLRAVRCLAHIGERNAVAGGHIHPSGL